MTGSLAVGLTEYHTSSPGVTWTVRDCSTESSFESNVQMLPSAQYCPIVPDTLHAKMSISALFIVSLSYQGPLVPVKISGSTLLM
jgi:hypothetical protein